MRFYLRKRRQPPAVIIVALIDVLIVVLIFLLVTTTFKKPQSSLQLALPESSQAKKAGANENAPLLVSIEATGSLRFGPEATPVTMARLESELSAASSTNALIKLTVSADKDAPWGQIVKVMDAAKKANIKNISAFTKPSTGS
jgi:biopolymer transport protein ExbD